jgi:hypothetical protein
MGCAGSKPHLPSLSSNHINSPQKGFILFNAKTIEYLSANETDIKTKLIQRCEAKLIKTATISQSKSLLGNAKRSLLSSSQSNQQIPPSGSNSKDTSMVVVTAVDQQQDSTPTSKISNLSLANSSSISAQLGNEYKPKEFAIYSAVDYVLKYAINDFDIENFKSSNHLSMKQIRKDIMKKYTSSRQSSSKLNNSISNNNSINNNNCTNTMTLKCQDTAFYKLALHTAIDEFGSFIQENFININEFQSTVKEKSLEPEDDVNKNGANDDNKSNTSSLNDKEALKLKEALEVARQNFYKGKMSMVCLNKAGGYVVKEVKDQTNDTSILDKSPSAKNTTISQSPTKESELDHEVAKIISEKEQADSLAEFLRIKSDSAKYLNETIDAIVSYTTKSGIFNDITSFEFEDEKEKTSFIAQLQSAFDQCLILKENLEKSNNLIKLFNSINENDYSSIDDKLVDLTVNLDYVNKEFKSYLKLLDDSLRHQLNHISKSNEENHNLVIKENSTKILEKNTEIRELVNDLYSNINSLPKKLFLSKNLPHPFVGNHSPSLSSSSPPVSPKPTLQIQPPSITIDNVSSVSPSTSISHEPIIKQNSPLPKQQEDEEPAKNDHPQPINIKKEIAYSILNIGEVLAKQIDYYSLDTNAKEGGEELNELIKLSEKQAAYEKQKLESQQQKVTQMSKSNSSSSTKSSSDQSPVKQEEIQHQRQEESAPAVAAALVEEKTEVKQPVEAVQVNHRDEELLDQNNKNNESIESAGESSISSPSLSNSLSPMSNSGSTSPVNDVVEEKQQEKESLEQDAVLISQDEQKLRPSTTPATTATTDYEDLEKAKYQLSNHHDEVSIQDDEIAFLVKEINMNMKLDAVNDKIELESNEVTNVVLVENNGASSEPKSSSSSSDVLSTYNNAGDNVHKYIENIIENASQHVNESNVVFRNNENTNNNNNNNNSNRISLDEELLYQLEQVDKKVKYMNETCSENEEDDDEDLDDENFDFDESNSNDEKLFHPTRTPAKIKSQVRQNRAVDLHEEIKQISNVIHDLVQTINVNRNTNQQDEVEEQQVTSDNNSEDGSHNSAGSLSGGEYPLSKKPTSIPSPVVKVNVNSSTAIENSKILNNSIKRNGSTASQGSSSIPIRQTKILTKQRAQTFEDDQSNANNESSINSESFKSAANNFESFVDLSTVSTSNKSNKKTATPDRLNKSLSTSSSSSSSSTSFKGANTPTNTPISNQTTPSSQKFRSKLPVKK